MSGPLTAADVLDVRQVAQMLRLPPSTVRDLARRGALPGRRLGRRMIFLRRELEQALLGLPSAAAAPSDEP
jgi:excisionase family DNA binding protein